MVAARTDAAASRSFPESVYRFRDAAEIAAALGATGFVDARSYERQHGDAGSRSRSPSVRRSVRLEDNSARSTLLD